MRNKGDRRLRDEESNREIKGIFFNGVDDGIDDVGEEGKTTLPPGWIPYPSPMNIVDDDDDCKALVHSNKKKTFKKKKKKKKKKIIGWKPNNGISYKDSLRLQLMLGEVKDIAGTGWKVEARARLKYKTTIKKKNFPVSRGHIFRSMLMRVDPVIEDLPIMQYNEVRKKCRLKKNCLNLSLCPLTGLFEMP